MRRITHQILFGLIFLHLQMPSNTFSEMAQEYHPIKGIIDRIDSDEDGRISKSEHQLYCEKEKFEDLDINKDGYIDEPEFEKNIFTVYSAPEPTNELLAQRYIEAGRKFFLENKIDEAMREYRMALNTYPEWGDTHAYIGYVYLKKGKFDMAIESFANAIKIGPARPHAYVGLGSAYLQKNMLHEALIELDKAIKLQPNNIAAYSIKADAYLQKGLIKEAAQELNTALIFDSDNIEVNQKLKEISDSSFFNLSGEKQNFNVILISLDSLRPDHLSCYGYDRNTTPNIDILARDGILFTQAISQASWTLPSHASLFTSKYVPAHNIYITNRVMPDRELTLAEVLKNHNYQTAAFTGGFRVSSIYGFNQGFDIYYDKKDHGCLDDVLPLAMRWLSQHKKNKFFIFLQAYDIHAPYSCPNPMQHMYDAGYKGIIDNFTIDHRFEDYIKDFIFKDPHTNKNYYIGPRDVDHIIAHYDAAITYADKKIGRLLDYLKELKLWDNTIIILFADHGESFMEHGYILQRKHGDMYEEAIHVPLIIKHPALNNITDKKIDTQVQLIDLMPTILEFLGIPIDLEMQGKSLVSLIYGKAGHDFNKYVFSSGATGTQHMLQACIRTREWKLLHFIKYPDGNMTEWFELYNLRSDPHESVNLIDKNQNIVFDLEERLRQWGRDVSRVEPPDIINSNLPEKMVQRMRKLGYKWLKEWGVD